jgi:hypothetical protein
MTERINFSLPKPSSADHWPQRDAEDQTHADFEHALHLALEQTHFEK